jgi:hypothetical protein
MKLYALTFKVGKYIIRTFKRSFFQVKYNSKTTNSNIMPKLLMAKVFLFPYKGSLQK